MIRVMFTRYDMSGEWPPYITDMPQVPAVGESVALPENRDDSRIWRVDHVRWVLESARWHAEIGVSS